jgi:hypothetical protein
MDSEQKSTGAVYIKSGATGKPDGDGTAIRQSGQKMCMKDLIMKKPNGPQLHGGAAQGEYSKLAKEAFMEDKVDYDLNDRPHDVQPTMAGVNGPG